MKESDIEYVIDNFDELPKIHKMHIGKEGSIYYSNHKVYILEFDKRPSDSTYGFISNIDITDDFDDFMDKIVYSFDFNIDVMNDAFDAVKLMPIHFPDVSLIRPVTTSKLLIEGNSSGCLLELSGYGDKIYYNKNRYFHTMFPNSIRGFSMMIDYLIRHYSKHLTSNSLSDLVVLKQMALVTNSPKRVMDCINQMYTN